MQIRKSVVSGSFYPDSPQVLENLVHQLILNAKSYDFKPKALIVPHAGYVYSGPIAATAYKLLAKLKSVIETVILIGPSHRVYIDEMAISSADYFETPLGRTPIDEILREKTLGFSGVALNDAAHRNEHSLEVQLPFLQVTLGNEFKILPIVANNVSPFHLGNILESIWGGNETLFVISTDLSHYLDYDSAREKDTKTVKSILDLDIDHIGEDDACGNAALKGFLWVARKKGLKPEILDLRNSGDTESNKARVVGYASISFN